MNFNNSRLVDHKPMKVGTFVPYMYRFVIIVKYLTNVFKLEWNLGIKFTLRFFFLSVYYQKPFVFSVSVFCIKTCTLKLNLRPKIGLNYAVSIVKRFVLSPAFSKKSEGTWYLAFRGAWCVMRGSEFVVPCERNSFWNFTGVLIMAWGYYIFNFFLLFFFIFLT